MIDYLGGDYWSLCIQKQETISASLVRGLQHPVREGLMKEAAINSEMLDEYDFSKGRRSKYVQRYAAGSNVVVISPDVAEAFPDSESVNEALRMLIKIAQQKKKATV